jgi:hypothetical protein
MSFKVVIRSRVIALSNTICSLLKCWQRLASLLLNALILSISSIFSHLYFYLINFRLSESIFFGSNLAGALCTLCRLNYNSDINYLLNELLHIEALS